MKKYEERVRILRGNEPITGIDTTYGNYRDRETGEWWRNIYTVDITHAQGKHEEALTSPKAMIHYVGSVKDYPAQQDEIVTWGSTYKKVRVRAFNLWHAHRKAQEILALKYRQLGMQ